MRDLEHIRSYVRTYMDLDDEDIVNDLLDAWALEGYRNIVRRTRRLPFFEASWDLTFTEGEGSQDAPADADELSQLSSDWGPLQHMDEDAARTDFNIYNAGPQTGHPLVWSLREGVLRVWPTPDADYEIHASGWRTPDFTWTATSGGVPDMPDELEDALLAWVMHRAYTHQDDPELAVAELQRYTAAVDEHLSYVVQGPLAAPLIIGGGRRRHPTPFPVGYQPIPWEL